MNDWGLLSLNAGPQPTRQFNASSHSEPRAALNVGARSASLLGNFNRRYPAEGHDLHKPGLEARSK